MVKQFLNYYTKNTTNPQTLGSRSGCYARAQANEGREGSSYDLPIAIGILAAAEQINNDLLEQFVIMGELSLDGTVNPIKGSLSIASKTKQEGFRGLILPKANAREAAVVEGLEVYGVSTINEVISILNGEHEILPVQATGLDETPDNYYEFDFCDVKT